MTPMVSRAEMESAIRSAVREAEYRMRDEMRAMDREVRDHLTTGVIMLANLIAEVAPDCPVRPRRYHLDGSPITREG
ncbi:MAG: hypothetical protein WD934_03835 [Gemmatimonadales bacterium]